VISTNSSFDERAGEYDAYRTGYSRTLYETLLELGFAPGWHVLDVACGTGLASEPLSKRGFRITGVDLSEPMLEHARQRINEGEFVQGSAESLPFRDAQFNAVICAQAIHWMDQEKAVAEMARVVAPGGRVAIWWKTMIVDDPLRDLRKRAAEAIGSSPPPDIMNGSFRAFYKQPFKERWVRVIPHVIMTTTERWLGYERSRARLSHYGERASDYLAALEAEMKAVDKGKPFHVRYTQFVYVAQV
jgi:ubiquinone/menaquinone biosynthesis C-methylase UbiE